MAASITYLGAFQAKISEITLSATSVEGIAHSLPTTPDIYHAVPTGTGGNTSFSGAILITAVSDTSVSFANSGGDIISGVCFLKVAHSLTK